MNVNQTLEQSPLVQEYQLTESNDQNVFLGTGVCNKSGLSVGVPFDALSMILLSGMIQHALPESHIYHLIADDHALANGFAEQDVLQAASKTRSTIQQVVAHLGINNYHIDTASQLKKTTAYSEARLLITERFPHEQNQYLLDELTDINFHQQTRGVGYKVGWRIPGTNENKTDEAYFDKSYDAVFPNTISFVYARPGITLDEKKPRSSPYICTDAGKHFLFKLEDAFDQKLSMIEGLPRHHKRTLIKNYNRLMLVYQDFTQTSIRGTFGERLKETITTIMHR